MASYTVKQIAEMLKTNEETVRRWIRSGKLESTILSKKGGNVVTTDALNKFIKETPKYATAITASLVSSPLALSVVVGGLLGGLLAFADDKKNKKISSNDVETFLKKKIQAQEKKLKEKNAELEKFKKEILQEQQSLEKYKYSLEQLDLHLIVSEINDKK